MYKLKEPVLNLIDRLCEGLRSERINYCQWKGHWKQNRWGQGHGDIDLLIDRVDLQRFRVIVCRLGFKEFLQPAEREIPGVSHYYGFDEQANKFTHIHVHCQIVFGHYLTTNYHLPLENLILSSAVPSKFFRVPAPEFDLILFVVRMVSSLTLWQSILRNRSSWLIEVQRELNYLEKKANLAKTKALLERAIPSIDGALFNECITALDPHCPRWKRFQVRHQLCTRLKAHSRRRRISDFLWKQRSRIFGKLRRLLPGYRSPNRLANGGRVIAIMGGDGAGKSTAVEELSGWLSSRFMTSRIHLGKPPKSALTIMVAVSRRTCLFVRSLVSKKHPGVVEADGPKLLLFLRSICIARDRYKVYVKARRFAANGGVVICDRYPTPQIKSMDCPNIWRLAGYKKNRLTDLFIRAEAFFYRQMMPPDLMIVLRVDPEIAVVRKVDEPEHYVRTRSLEIWNLDLSETAARVVDAGRSKADVLSDLRSLVWHEL